jgi:hypothetical protein
MLANAPRGLSEEVLVVAHGFSAEMLAGLVSDGLATVVSETKKGRNENKKDQGRVRPRGLTIEVNRIRITDAGRACARRVGRSSRDVAMMDDYATKIARALGIGLRAFVGVLEAERTGGIGAVFASKARADYLDAQAY